MAKWLIAIFLVILLDQSSKSGVVKLGWPIFYNQKWLLGRWGGSVWLQGVVCCSLVGLIIYWWKKKEKMGREARIGLSFLVGGGVSNQMDKLVRGAVIDFIDIKILPVFNLADVLITVGAVLVVYNYFYVKTKNSLRR